jgi:hypothetical protein
MLELHSHGIFRLVNGVHCFRENYTMMTMARPIEISP